MQSPTIGVELTLTEIMQRPQLDVLAARIVDESLKASLSIHPGYEIRADEMEVTL